MKPSFFITYTGRHWVGEMFDDDFRGDTAEQAILHAAKVLNADGVKASKVSIEVPIGVGSDGLLKVKRIALWSSEGGLL